MNPISPMIPPNLVANSPAIGGGIAPPPSRGQSGDPAFREAFDDFVGQTFFGQMLASMRKTVEKPAYFHGGRAEEVFQSQLDQILAERMADASAPTLTGPMFELYSLPRP